jgi:hypothetical protein
MSLKMEAPKMGGLLVCGKSGFRIVFIPPPTTQGSEPRLPKYMEAFFYTLLGLGRGSVQMGQRIWMGQDTDDTETVNLDNVDLEQIIQMRATLLGPGEHGAQNTRAGEVPWVSL